MGVQGNEGEVGHRRNGREEGRGGREGRMWSERKGSRMEGGRWVKGEEGESVTWKGGRGAEKLERGSAGRWKRVEEREREWGEDDNTKMRERTEGGRY